MSLIILLVNIITVNIITIYEGLLGLLQAVGIKVTYNSYFFVTGTFNNPGPYGGLIAILLAFLGSYLIKNRSAAKWSIKALVILSSISCALCIIVLPATRVELHG